jgi:hypothetical protein
MPQAPAASTSSISARHRSTGARRAGGLRDRGSLAGQPSRVGRRRQGGERRQRRRRRRAGVTVHLGGMLGPHLGVLGLGEHDGRSAPIPGMGYSTRISGQGTAATSKTVTSAAIASPIALSKHTVVRPTSAPSPPGRRPPPSRLYNGHSFSVHESRFRSIVGDMRAPSDLAVGGGDGNDTRLGRRPAARRNAFFTPKLRTPSA